MSDSIWQFADELGPEKVLHIYEPRSGLKAFVAVDNVACGPAIGGCRMAADVSVSECVRLARAMTLKNAAAGLPHGGGKSAIVADAKLAAEHKERLLRSFARAIAELRSYIVGPDMGTDETCMAWCHDEMGRAVGLPAVLGGIPLDELGATGYGLIVAAETAQGFSDVKLDGARVVIEGFGAVGRHAAAFLQRKGALIVAVADSRGMTGRDSGLDVEHLTEHKTRAGKVADFEGGRALDQSRLLDIDCDIFIPAARPDVIRADNADRVKARLVLPGANIAVTEQAALMLHRRGVLVIPDFIANAGGVICASAEYHGETRSGAFAAIEEKIRTNTALVLGRSRDSGEAPTVVATQVAIERVQEAMRYRRS